MSETAVASPASTAAPQTFLARHHFLLRRLHSLSGIVPVGIFVITHLFTNFQMAPAILGDEGTFQHEVEFIHGMPALLFVEVGLWLGIGFHAALGLVYTFVGNNKMGVPESTSYQYRDSWRYTFQRITGILALIFIFLHIATLRWRWDFFGWFTPFYVDGPAPDGEKVLLAHATTAIALQYSVWVLLLYVVGVGSTIFHWANGLWTAAITWGLTISVGAQRRWGYFCAGLGLVLTVFAIGGIGGALAYNVTPEQRAAFEAKIQESRGVSPLVPPHAEPMLTDPATVPARPQPQMIPTH